MNNLLGLLANLRMFRVTKWGEDSDGNFLPSSREPASVAEANISTSLREDRPDHHALLLDLDVPAWLVPSSTEGHSHLYVDAAIPSKTYFALLDLLAEAKVIDRGYANASKTLGGSALRLPWVKKPENASPKTSADLPF